MSALPQQGGSFHKLASSLSETTTSLPSHKRMFYPASGGFSPQADGKMTEWRNYSAIADIHYTHAAC
jgi:hypothetical protein